MAATAADLTGANLVTNHFILPLIFYLFICYAQGAHIMLAGIVFQLGKSYGSLLNWIKI